VSLKLTEEWKQYLLMRAPTQCHYDRDIFCCRERRIGFDPCDECPIRLPKLFGSREHVDKINACYHEWVPRPATLAVEARCRKCGTWYAQDGERIRVRSREATPRGRQA
jgi:hypothetical protein